MHGGASCARAGRSVNTSNGRGVIALLVVALVALGTPAWAAPAPTQLLDETSATDASSYTTGAFALTANKPTLFSVTGHLSSGTGVNTPTITCHSTTWALVTSVTSTVGGNDRKLFLFRTMVTSNSGAATCAISFGGQTQTRSSWSVVEWAGADTSGTFGSGAIVQSAVQDAGGSVSTLTVTLAALTAGNRPYAVFTSATSTAVFTQESGWTVLSHDVDGTEGLTHMTTWKDATDDATPTVDFTVATTHARGLAVEIKAAGATAFPQVPGSTSGNSGAQTTTHTINLPASIVSGERLLAVVCLKGWEGFLNTALPSGWTLVVNRTHSSPGRTFVAMSRDADGTEGASVTVTTSVAVGSSHASFRITGFHADAPTATTATDESGTATPDPPSHTPAWGAADTLWFAAVCYSPASTRTVSAYPSSYTNGLNPAWADIEGIGLGIARRELNASSEDPGTFTLSGTGASHIMATLAVRPGEGAPPPPSGATIRIIGGGVSRGGMLD